MTPGPTIRATATPMDPVTKSGLRTLAMAGGLTRRRARTAMATVGGRKIRAPRAMIGGQACH